MKKYLLFAVLMTMASSCSKDLEKEDGTNLTTSKEQECSLNFKALFSNNHIMKEDEAQVLAIKASEKLFGGTNGLKCSKIKIVQDSKPYTKTNRLKSIGNTSIDRIDTLAYIVNFADSAGYAIICADDRVGCPILACVEEGHLDDKSIEENPGLQLFMENVDCFIEKSIMDFENSKDSLLALAYEIRNKQNENSSDKQLKTVYTGSYDIILGEEEVSPLLYTRWGQSYSPYNDNMPICSSTGNHMPTGCWATAIGQVLAYWQYPSSIDGYSFDWNLMTQDNQAEFLYGSARTMVANLMSSIGSHVNMNYGCDASGANSTTSKNWLSSLGYINSTSDYSWDFIRTQLNLNHPILIDGYSRKVTHTFSSTTYKDGHVWLIDGYKTTKCQYETYRIDLDRGTHEITSSTTVYRNTLLHNNWGWSGLHNGYYAEGCFNIQDYQSLDPYCNISSSQYNYRYKLKLCAPWR